MSIFFYKSLMDDVETADKKATLQDIYCRLASIHEDVHYLGDKLIGSNNPDKMIDILYKCSHMFGENCTLKDAMEKLKIIQQI